MKWHLSSPNSFDYLIYREESWGEVPNINLVNTK